MMWNNRKFTRETLLSYSLKTQNYVSVLDNSVNQIYTQTDSVITRSDIGKLSILSQIMNRYEKYQTIKQLREYISGVDLNNDLLANIRVYVRSLNTVYNSEYSQKASFETISDETYARMAALNVSLPSQIIYHEGRLIMLIKSSQKNPFHMVEAEFSLSQLKDEFDKQSRYDNSYYIFNFHDGDYILNNISDERIYEAAISSCYEDGITDFRVNGQLYFVFPVRFENMDAVYIQIVPGSEILQPVYLSSFYTIFFIFFMLISVLIFFVGVINIIHRPLNKLVNAFLTVETGDLNIRIHETSKSEFSYLYSGFNDMADHLENLIDEVYNQKMMLQKAEFKQLQAQINPHFLYNSFFMLQRMIQKNMQEESLEMAKGLGIYFKYITKNNSDCVLLKDEYQHAKIYSNIQAMRFEGRIETSFGELPDAYAAFAVPRLILQPIIENAYNYGLENKYCDGLLMVSFHTQDNGLSIVIEDNGDELTDEKLSQLSDKLKMTAVFEDSAEITGLINIFRRIHSFYKNSSTLILSRSDIGGLKVTIFLSNENEEDTL